MWGKCCRCRAEDVDSKELVVTRKESIAVTKTLLPTISRPSIHQVSGGLGPGILYREKELAASPINAPPKLSRELLKQLTLDLWHRAKHGIPVSAFANGDLSTAFSAVVKLSIDFILTVVRLVDAETPQDLTIVQVPLRSVSSIYEGPNVRTPSKAIRQRSSLSVEPADSGEHSAPTVDEYSCLERTVQLQLDEPIGDIHSICIICGDLTQRRDIFAGLSVLRCLSQKAQ